MGEEFATKEEVHGIRGRLEIIERALRREVGPVLDVVHTAAGVVSAAAGDVADVVEQIFESCPHHPLLPTNGKVCGADGCEFSKKP